MNLKIVDYGILEIPTTKPSSFYKLIYEERKMQEQLINKPAY